MTGTVDRAAAWMYRGVWGVLTEWFRVPAQAPTLPAGTGEVLQSFRPSGGYLRYLKFQWAIVVLGMAAVVVPLSIMLAVGSPLVAVFVIPLALSLAVFGATAGYLAIHLQFDTTWYVLSPRSLRIRRGIWVIQEATITFENVQNVTVESGPVERWFGIGNVLVDTAGGGQGAKDAEGKGRSNSHRGEIAGVSKPSEIRQLISSRLRHSRSAGLGDEWADAAPWSARHIAALREIRDVLKS